MHCHPQKKTFFIWDGSAAPKTENEKIKANKFGTVSFSPKEPRSMAYLDELKKCQTLLVISPPYNPEEVTYLGKLK